MTFKKPFCKFWIHLFARNCQDLIQVRLILKLGRKSIAIEIEWMFDPKKINLKFDVTMSSKSTATLSLIGWWQSQSASAMSLSLACNISTRFTPKGSPSSPSGSKCSWKQNTVFDNVKVQRIRMKNLPNKISKFKLIFVIPHSSFNWNPLLIKTTLFTKTHIRTNSSYAKFHKMKLHKIGNCLKNNDILTHNNIFFASKW